MSSSSNTSDSLHPVDYPIGGIGSPDWVRVSPNDPSVWHAFEFSGEGDAQRNYFLGAGETDLDESWIAQGSFSLTCIKGFVYLVQGSGVTAMPAKDLGYVQCLTSERIAVFCGFSDLLVVEVTGAIRYDPDAAIDNLAIYDASDDEVILAGLRRYDQPDEVWSVRVSDVPILREVDKLGDSNA